MELLHFGLRCPFFSYKRVISILSVACCIMLSSAVVRGQDDIVPTGIGVGHRHNIGHSIPSDHDVPTSAEAPDVEPTRISRLTLPSAPVMLRDEEARREAVESVFGEPKTGIIRLEPASSVSEQTTTIVALRDLPRSEPEFKLADDPFGLASLDDPVPAKDSIEINTGFKWGPAINQSLILIGIQHGYALIAQEKTRRALKGPFFRDYWRSVKGLKGWDDGNRFFTNYIAHPMQGGLTGFIYVQNSPRAMNQEFNESKQYWKDRFTAFLWSTAWSTQWELGPISQSSIGNVGLYGGMGYVDLVITPTVGTGWLIAEEAIDRYVIRKLETANDTVRKLTRMFLNPMRTIANLLRFKHPWYRDRPVGF